VDEIVQAPEVGSNTKLGHLKAVQGAAFRTLHPRPEKLDTHAKERENYMGWFSSLDKDSEGSGSVEP